MTTGTGRDRARWRVEWAAHQLGVSKTDPPAEARSAFLRQLPGLGFLPSPELRLAHQILSNLPYTLESGADEKARRAEEDRLRQMVEEFASQFWSMRPEERQAHWRELDATCSDFPLVQARLSWLQPGLHLTVPQLDPNDQPFAWLAQGILELFILSSNRRSEKWREFYRTNWNEIASIQEAAKHLRLDLPELAALEPYLVEDLATSRWRIPRENAVRVAPNNRQAKLPAPKHKSSIPHWIFVGVVVSFLRCLATAPRPENVQYKEIGVPATKHIPEGASNPANRDQ